MVHVWEFENQFCLAQNSMCASVLSISNVKSLTNVAFDDSVLLATCLLHKERFLYENFFTIKDILDHKKRSQELSPFII